MKNETARNTSNGISDGLRDERQASRNHTGFRPDSQCSEILEHIRRHGSITSYQGAMLGIMGFNARITELRQAGYPIVCTMQPHTNKRGIYTLAEKNTA